MPYIIKKSIPENSFTEKQENVPHSLHDDLYGIFTGSLFIALGVTLLKAAGLLTGGIAGISLLLSLEFTKQLNVIFLFINLPFFIFGYNFMGKTFILKSIIGNIIIFFLLKIFPQLIELNYIHPAFAAVSGGTLAGMGVLAYARHGAGVGGIGILTLWLLKRYHINAGVSQALIDACIMLAALAVMSQPAVLWSALSAIAMSSMVIAWHRPGRYNAS